MEDRGADVAGGAPSRLGAVDITAMIWAWLVWIIGAGWLCVVSAAMSAAMTAVGLIHSPYADGRLFLPGATTPHIAFTLVAGYLLLGLLCAVLYRAGRVSEGIPSRDDGSVSA